MSSIEKAYVHEMDITQTTPGDASTTLAKIRAYVGRSFLNDKKEFEDKHGFWINVEMWGERAQHLSLIEPGANIQMTGRYVQNKFVDKDNNKRQEMIFRAKEIALLPRSIASIAYKPRAAKADQALEYAA